MNKFNLNSLKGRVAEQIVQDLFANSGYNIFNYGLERLHPSLSKLIRTNNIKTAKALRHMPDFVVQSSQTGDLFYLKVKFWVNGFFEFDDTYKDYPYRNAWFVIVSPSKVQCMHYKRLSQGYAITADTTYYLQKVRSFHIDNDLLKEYVEYAGQMFQAFG